jgi:hypothetical protein
MRSPESMPEPFTAELTIQPGEAVDGSAANGFAESVVTLRATSRGAPGSGVVDLRWGAEPLGTGLSASTFLDDFWSGASVAHIDALAFGRMLLRRLLGHPNVRDRWTKIELWRGERPLGKPVPAPAWMSVRGRPSISQPCSDALSKSALQLRTSLGSWRAPSGDGAMSAYLVATTRSR